MGTIRGSSGDDAPATICDPSGIGLVETYNLVFVSILAAKVGVFNSARVGVLLWAVSYLVTNFRMR